MVEIVEGMKANTSIRVFDISSNLELSPAKLIGSVGEMVAGNRSIEYLGLSKLNIGTNDVLPLFDNIGRFTFDGDVDERQKELKNRDAIVEKNKKLKASKKPEEPVPQLDDIQEITRINSGGQEIKEWVTIKNPQLKHINLCMNSIDNEAEAPLIALVERTTDEFSLTVSSNPIEQESLQKVHDKITAMHKAVIDRQIAQHEEEGAPAENAPVIDAMIHLKRLAV